MGTGEATAWVTHTCAGLGLRVTSAGLRTHDQPWSFAVVYDIREADGADGRVWFKGNGIGTRHEPALVSALASLVPDLVPTVLAVDAERAWSLTRDAGPTWRSAIPADDQWPLWEGLLQRYAAAQLALAAHESRLLATGLPERSPATLPTQAADLVTELARLGSDSGGLSAADSQALTARLPAYGRWCRELSESGIPCTIQHDDLHANNICGPGTAAEPLGGLAAGSRVIDWGDASIGHPFGTMLVTLRSIAHNAGCEVDDPRVRRVRDAYLQPFLGYGPRAELVALIEAAQRVGTVIRALSWRDALLGAPTRVHCEQDFPVAGWLLELLTD